MLAKGSSPALAEFVRDELFDPVKSPKASPPPPKASNTLLPAVEAGAAKASNAGDEDADGEPNASNGEAFSMTGAAGGAAGAAADMSLNGSRDAAELARLPARLVGVGASKASKGEEAAGLGRLASGTGAGAGHQSQKIIGLFGGLNPMRSLVAGGVLTLDEEKLDPGGGAILNDPNFGAGGGGGVTLGLASTLHLQYCWNLRSRQNPRSRRQPSLKQLEHRSC